MTVELLELAADALGDLLAGVVFVGGATVTLWITDPGAPPVRPTIDVDVVVGSRAGATSTSSRAGSVLGASPKIRRPE